MPPTRRRFLFLSRAAVTTAVALAFVLLVGTALLTAFSTRGMVASNRKTVDAERTLIASTRLLTRLADVETAARRAVLVPEATNAARYEDARVRLLQDLATLQREFSTRREAAPLVAELGRLITAKLEELSRSVAVAREGAPPRDATSYAASTRLTAEILQLGHLLQQQEFSDLAHASASAVMRAEIIQSLNTALIAMSVALVAAGAWWLLRRVRDLEGLITVCAWTRRVQWQGRWVSFEEYLLNRFHLRCTHGICDEAAEKMRKDAAQLVLSLDLPKEMTQEQRAEGRPILEPASDT
ncbi:MAG TPA: CHASE3 domain-containing protein [Opitutaceae bacterium]|nr:CHASE3 domain-containing protein [Opitutaceae bacterium]